MPGVIARLLNGAQLIMGFNDKSWNNPVMQLQNANRLLANLNRHPTS